MMITATLCILALTGQSGDYRKNLNTFFDVERAFAKMCALKGARESFMHFFAPDGIAFNPGPVKAKDDYSAQPPETTPLKYLLAWEPKVAECSLRADLGFTTGPYRMIDLSGQGKPIQQGCYFSIWRKQPDGELKVVFDMGTPMATPPVFPNQMKVRGNPSPAFVTADLLDRAKSNIERFEDDIRKSTPDELPKTLEMAFNKELIAYRAGSSPLQNEADALDWHKKNRLALSDWEIRKTEVAGSADLVWCWGRYAGTLNEKPVQGYWAHVWKSEIGKGWHIVADVMNVVPAKVATSKL